MSVIKLIGSDPNQVSRNRDLGSLAFQDAESVIVENLTVSTGVINNLSVTGGVIINQLQAQSTKSNYSLGGSASVTFNVTLASNTDWTTGVIKIEATGSDRTSGGYAGAWWQYANLVLNGASPINSLADSGGTTGSFVVAISGDSGTGTQVLTITVTATALDGITASLSISNLLGISSIT